MQFCSRNLTNGDCTTMGLQSSLVGKEGFYLIINIDLFVLYILSKVFFELVINI